MFSHVKCLCRQRSAVSWVTLTPSYRLSGPGLVSLAGLTLWLLLNRYLLLCVLRLNHDFLMADVNNSALALSFASDSGNLHWKCTTQPSETMLWGEHKFLSGFLCFKRGDSLVEDYECSGSSSKCCTVKYVTKIHKIIIEDWCCTNLRDCWQVWPLILKMLANSVEDLGHVADLRDVSASVAHCWPL
jgi:hypothetical protein